MCDIVTEAEDQVQSSGKPLLLFESHTFFPRFSPPQSSPSSCVVSQVNLITMPPTSSW